ncbi:uncharacterized protein B0T15DRAFT_512419 [Chaetomium strumarium]|uniref:Uncharacterized protein n=1 Tax=Chaetomium strumarium TaxID=1170767 RepID=A0AAJ0M098_9PEZI|nr:hypothetical protein B0T15DRAFT_512419 [Chaetomium strumarium]
MMQNGVLDAPCPSHAPIRLAILFPRSFSFLLDQVVPDADAFKSVRNVSLGARRGEKDLMGKIANPVLDRRHLEPEEAPEKRSVRLTEGRATLQHATAQVGATHRIARLHLQRGPGSFGLRLAKQWPSAGAGIAIRERAISFPLSSAMTIGPGSLHLASTLPHLPGFENDQEEGNHRLTGLPSRHTKSEGLAFSMLKSRNGERHWLDPEAENCKCRSGRRAKWSVLSGYRGKPIDISGGVFWCSQEDAGLSQKLTTHPSFPMKSPNIPISRLHTVHHLVSSAPKPLRGPHSRHLFPRPIPQIWEVWNRF